MDFRDKVAFITGGASGIGLAIAQALASKGARIALADVQDEALQRACDALAYAGGNTLPVRLDVTDRPGVLAAADQVEEHFGRVDLVFNNAGIGDAGTPLDRVSDAFFDWIVGVNLFGVMNVMKAFVPKLRHHGPGGHILNTSSMAGLVVMPGWNQGLYSATKMAVLALSLDMREVLSKEGIGVSALCPGLVETNILHNAVDLRPVAVEDDVPAFPDMLTQKGMPAAEAAEIALLGIQRNQPIIVTHPELWPLVENFHKTIHQAFLPADDAHAV